MHLRFAKSAAAAACLAVLAVGVFPLGAAEEGSSFMGTSLIHMPTSKPLEEKTLEVRINHRFGSAQTGFDNFFGLDDGANVQLAADYGFTNYLSFGMARTSDFKTYEVRSKWVPFEQSSTFPISIGAFAAAGQETSKQQIVLGPLFSSLPATGSSVLDAKIAEVNNRKYTLTDNDKRSYTGAVFLSRRFASFLTLQLAPMFTHRNFVKPALGNDRTGLSFGGRIKIGKHVDLTFETIATPKRDYIGDDYAVLDRESEYGLRNFAPDEINRSNLAAAYLVNVVYDKPVPYYSVPASIGLDIDTGGHVFQLFVSNSRTMAHTQLLRGADFDYKKRDYVVGFNLNRLFWFSEKDQAQRMEGGR